jgi:two-component system, OmpR family, response regulator ArlR
MAKILIVEDEKQMADFISLELKHEGYEVDICYDGEQGYEKAIEANYDIILLDIMLPKINGMEVCRRLRIKKETPIIMLTAKGDITDKANGLDIGADDYLTKPFEIEELLARMRVILRRKTQKINQSKIIQVADLKLDLEKKQVSRRGNNIELTKKEYELLEYLMKNNGIVISREKIIESVWNYDFVGDTKIVDVFIRYLRSKINLFQMYHMN